MIFAPLCDVKTRDVDDEAFAQARIRVLGENTVSEGIGTLSEKALHKILKYYFEPDARFHEVPFLGSVADVKNEKGVIEIQTRGLGRLSEKLDKFLPECPVTVVYPLAGTKLLHWIDPSSGEISEGKKSPKHETLHDAVWELYNLRSCLSHPNFTLVLCFLDVEEYKKSGGSTNGRKNRSTRIERIPNAIEKIAVFQTKEDYLAFLPEELPDPFTAKELAARIAPRYRYTFSLVKILSGLGILSECGKRSNSKLYTLRREIH